MLNSGTMDGLRDDDFLQRMKSKDDRDSFEGKKAEDLPSGPVYIFPTLQFPVINFHEDEMCFDTMLKFMADPANNISNLKLATGYLNL